MQKALAQNDSKAAESALIQKDLDEVIAKEKTLKERTEELEKQIETLRREVLKMKEVEKDRFQIDEF